MLNFCDRLVEERKRLGLNQKDLASAVGVSKTTQFNYEKGDRSPDTAYLMSVSELGMDVSYLISGSRTLNSAVVEKVQHTKTDNSLSDSAAGITSIEAFAKKLDSLNHEFKKLQLTANESAGTYGNDLPLKDLIAYNTTARGELTQAIEAIMAVLQEEPYQLTPAQFSAAVVGALSGDEIKDSIANANML